MTYQTHCTLPSEILEQIASDGLDALPELLRVLINSAMQVEREKHLGVAAYEQSVHRQGHANGCKPRTVATRVGKVTFAVPQVREGGLVPQALALAEMYGQGVSTRKVAAITEQLCGHNVTSMQVSRAAAQLDEILQAWRQRSLGQMPYLYLDARYEKVRQQGQVRDAAVLVAVGVDSEDKRQILGVSVSVSEQEVHWHTFLQSLVERGLCGVQLVVNDAPCGLQQARKAVFAGVAWQRCHFHLQQNASAFVPKVDLKAEVAADIRAIFTAPNRTEAAALLTKLSAWLEQNLPEGWTVFDFPAAHCRLLRTTNGLERINKELKRCTRVVGIFPNNAAC